MRTEPLYPIDVQLVGTDGNAFALIGKVGAALVDGEVPDDAVSEFVNEAMEQKSYDDLLNFLAETVNVS